jgi:hypothetical protein
MFQTVAQRIFNLFSLRYHDDCFGINKPVVPADSASSKNIKAILCERTSLVKTNHIELSSDIDPVEIG